MKSYLVSEEVREKIITSILHKSLEGKDITHDDLGDALKISYRNRNYKSYITSLNPTSTTKNNKLNPFIVADTETITVDGKHVPYAAGLMLVRLSEEINKYSLINTIFSEDYTNLFYTFESG